MLEHLISIVAIDQRGAIGCKNRLPWTIKSDLAFFKKTTMGQTVIMGRRTYESIGGCLKGRTNLVLSHSTVLFHSTDTCQLVNSVEEALANGMSLSGEDTYLIGGAATYSEFAPLVDRYLVTVVDHIAPDADAFLSSEIMEEFSHWPSEEVATFPAEANRDEFAFRILCYTAPDATERREARKALANQHLSKRLNASSRKSRSSRKTTSMTQPAFLF